MPYSYDYWYQPLYNVMISTSWGHPKLIQAGFNLDDVQNGKYGHTLYVWNWKEGTLRQTIDLDPVKACMPLEVRRCLFHFVSIANEHRFASNTTRHRSMDSLAVHSARLSITSTARSVATSLLSASLRFPRRMSPVGYCRQCHRSLLTFSSRWTIASYTLGRTSKTEH